MYGMIQVGITINSTQIKSLYVATAHLIVALTQELELLRLLVHEHTIQVARLNRPDLYGFVTPAHNLTSAYERYGGGHFAPLQHHVLRNLERNGDVSGIDTS